MPTRIKVVLVKSETSRIDDAWATLSIIFDLAPDLFGSARHRDSLNLIMRTLVVVSHHTQFALGILIGAIGDRSHLCLPFVSPASAVEIIIGIDSGPTVIIIAMIVTWFGASLEHTAPMLFLCPCKPEFLI